MNKKEYNQINEVVQDMTHDLLTAYYTGFAINKLCSDSSLQIVAVQKTPTELTKKQNNVTVHYCLKEDFWAMVLIRAELVPDKILINDIEWVVTGKKTLRLRSQCIERDEQFECISTPASVINFKTLSEAVNTLLI